MRTSTLAAWAGLLPVIAAHAAFLINLNSGLEPCFGYFEGCYSVSRAIRTGPGLLLFKVLALPAAWLMAWYWSRWCRPVAGLGGVGVTQSGDSRRKWASRLGMAGAVFFLVYALWLGTEGEVYRWMRRYGVVFYFAFTSLAQLLLSSSLWRERRNIEGGRLTGVIRLHFIVVVMMWGLGVASAFKRKLIDDPTFLDRVENALEWNFALIMCLSFVALALFHRAAEQLATKQ